MDEVVELTEMASCIYLIGNPIGIIDLNSPGDKVIVLCKLQYLNEEIQLGVFILVSRHSITGARESLENSIGSLFPE